MSELATLMLGPLAFVLTSGLHAAACHMPVGGTSVTKFFAVAIPIGAALILRLLAEPSVGAPAWVALLLYALLSELYVFLFTMIAISVSAALLHQLRLGPCHLDELNARYRDEQMVEQRIQRLQTTGFLRIDGARCVLTERGRTTLRVFAALGHFFRHAARLTPEHGGQDPPVALI